MAKCPACHFEMKPGQGTRQLKEPARSMLRDFGEYHTPCAVRTEGDHSRRMTRQPQARDRAAARPS